MPLERLLPLEELALRVALSIRLVLEDDRYSVQAAELCRVAVELLGSTINSPLLRRVLVNSRVRWRFRPFPPGSRVLVNEARMSKVAFIQRNYVQPLIISAQMMESEI